MSAEMHLKRNIPPEHSYVILGRKRGEYRRGLELVAASIPPMPIAVSDENARRKLFDAESGLPALEHNRALFLMDLGRLDEAEAILRGPVIRQICGYYDDGFRDEARYQFIAQLNLCDLLLLRGRLSEAYAIADSLVTMLECDDGVNGHNGTPSKAYAQVEAANGSCSPFTTGFNPHARRAVALMYQGNVPGALADFKRAEHYQQLVLGYYWLRNAFSRVRACEKHGRSYKVDSEAIFLPLQARYAALNGCGRVLAHAPRASLAMMMKVAK